MIRNEVRARIAELIEGSGLAGTADVSDRYPGDKQQTAEMVFCDRTTGSVSFPFGMTPPKIQQDDFTVLVVVRITARPDLSAAMVRCQELAALIVGLLADGTLDGFSANGEEVTDTHLDGVLVDTREGDDPKTGVSLAIAEITVPFQTRSLNAQEG